MTILQALLLFAIATTVAMVARRVKVPYTVSLVIAGLALGSLGKFQPPHLTKELLFGIFLPGLLFEAAFHISRTDLWANVRAVLLLAVPGVVIAMLIITAVVAPGARALHLANFGALEALAFAALIGATDPIAVVALFRQLGAPKRLRVIVEAESLINDGTAVVCFAIAMSIVGGKAPTTLGVAVDFVEIVGGGMAIGAVVAFAARLLMRLAPEPMISVALTVLGAYGSFEIAELLHFSGVIATVVTGLIVGDAARSGRRSNVGAATRVSIESFWEVIAFALNSIVFLLIGFEVRVSELFASIGLIALAYVAVTISRGLLVVAVLGLLRKTSEKMPWRWGAVLGWGGLRGALSMVLALSTPQDLPHRSELIAMTYGVVVVSLLLQGLTVGPLLKRLGLAAAKQV